jgi:hypothetical protein
MSQYFLKLSRSKPVFGNHLVPDFSDIRRAQLPHGGRGVGKGVLDQTVYVRMEFDFRQLACSFTGFF